MILLMAVLFVSASMAATLQWDAVANATGYKLHYGEAPGNYTHSIDVGNNTQYNLDTLPLVQGRLYYFAVTAYNTAGESSYSAPVSWTPPDTTPPDPPKWESPPVTSP